MIRNFSRAPRMQVAETFECTLWLRGIFLLFIMQINTGFFTAIYEFPTVVKIRVVWYIITSGRGDIPWKT